MIVIEIQAGETVSTIVNSYDDRDEAESRYHTILAAAAVSSVPNHSAVMLTTTGQFIKSETYSHSEE